MPKPIPHRYAIRKSVCIDGYDTSICVEQEFLDQIDRILKRDKVLLNDLITRINKERPFDQNISTAVRLYILKDLLTTIANYELEIETNAYDRATGCR